MSRKRKFSEDNTTTIDDLCKYIGPKEGTTITKNISFISPSKLCNFVNNDCILDYYKLSSNKKQRTTHNHDINILCKKGLEFEEKIYVDLKDKYNDKFVKIANDVTDLNKTKAEMTKNEMLKGTPIIAQGVLIDDELKLHGICDLLIRSDYINKIFIKIPEPLTQKDETHMANNLTGNYHYRVFDIKWTTVNLCSKGKRLLNEGRNKQYKTQLLIYNIIMGRIQGYIPHLAYIVGKGWKYKQKNETFSGINCYDSIGCINYDSDSDTESINTTKNAIEWYRTIEQEYDKISLYPPSYTHLYPNMCNKYDEPYHNKKYKYAKDIHELTLLYQVGITQRHHAMCNGIYSFKDPRCNAKNLGYKDDSKIKQILDNIIQVNRDDDCIFLPNKLISFEDNWHTRSKYDFYVDFETITECLCDKEIDIHNSHNKGTFIFMIGVGYIDDTGIWKFNCFYANDYSKKEEERIFSEFKDMIFSICKGEKPRFFHWSNAELTNMKTIALKHGNVWDNYFDKIQWIDMLNVFKLNKIAVKGAFNYGLKSITNAMYDNNFVPNKWSSDGPSDGLSAMMEAINYYNSDVKDESIIKKICDYNEVDCKTVYNIREFLINNKC